MSKFETKRYKGIKAREQVEQLFIHGQGVLDVFETNLQGTTFKSEFHSIIRYIEHFANGNSIGKRLVYVKGVTDGVTELEFRTKHLRIYAIQLTGKKIITYAGIKRKADSSDNIRASQQVKKAFLNHLKQKK